MMMAMQVIAVLDIGKTNKKALIYDYQLNLVDQKRRAFPEIERDGLRLEQPENVFEWFCDCLKDFAKQYDITAISVTTHGATAVCIDDIGNISVPPISYTNTLNTELRDEFFAKFGDKKELQRTTATAEIGDMINLGKILFFISKKYPNELAKTRWILNYPQYFGFKLTGIAGIEPTMLGCHTYLYDPYIKEYSQVAHKLGVIDKLPDTIQNSWSILGKVKSELASSIGLNKDCIATLGVHDSNASLIPYLLCNKNENFVLNSTGTWCVAMTPANEIRFADEELGKTIYYNMDIFCNPVKTSIFMGGLEYETYSSILSSIHGRQDCPEFDLSLYQKVIDNCSEFILPSVMKGTGIFPDSAPRIIESNKVFKLEEIQAGNHPAFFSNYEYAHAVLNISLVLQTISAIRYTGYEDNGTIYVEGGFRNNQPYLQLLTAAFPQSKVAITAIQEATAFGSAILALAALKDTTPKALADLINLNSKTMFPTQLPNFKSYTDKFLNLFT